VIEKNESGRPSLTFKPEKKIRDGIFAPVSMNGKYEIIQVRRLTFTEDNYSPKNRILTFLLNTTNGRGYFLNTGIPEIATMTNGLITTLSDDHMVARISKY
jgi:hypothetical protein